MNFSYSTRNWMWGVATLNLMNVHDGVSAQSVLFSLISCTVFFTNGGKQHHSLVCVYQVSDFLLQWAAWKRALVAARLALCHYLACLQLCHFIDNMVIFLQSEQAAGTVVQCVKLPLAMPAVEMPSSPTGISVSPGCSGTGQLLLIYWQTSKRWLRLLGPCHLPGSPGWRSWLQASA